MQFRGTRGQLGNAVTRPSKVKTSTTQWSGKTEPLGLLWQAPQSHLRVTLAPGVLERKWGRGGVIWGLTMWCLDDDLGN